MASRYDEGIEALQFEAQGFVEVVMIDRLLKTMDVFLPVDVEALLILLERNAIIFFAAEHYGGALHVVVNHIFQNWYHALVLECVEEDFLFCRDQDLLVAHLEIGVGVQTQSRINHPSFLAFFIFASFHQQYLGRTPGDQNLV